MQGKKQWKPSRLCRRHAEEQEASTPSNVLLPAPAPTKKGSDRVTSSGDSHAFPVQRKLSCHGDGEERDEWSAQNSRLLLIGPSGAPCSTSSLSSTKANEPFLDNFPHVWDLKPSSTSASISPPRNCNLLQLSPSNCSRPPIPSQDVPERPPPEHARRRRPLCLEQSRRSESTSAHPTRPASLRPIAAHTRRQSPPAPPGEAQLSFCRRRSADASPWGACRAPLEFCCVFWRLSGPGPRLILLSAAKCRTRRLHHPHIRRREGIANRGLVHPRAADPRCSG